ncbi:DUF4920 domain-containing protein [Dyadobacter psychrotolerans]|uniref:DUF4920 domain-containing protein n=1 Tax=Dyadobacter psychrotolerans TaxID=2541721 RepID=A0A4R5E0D9_9BACT|nr:DUF4920 domain-containing protein [Dyadobacter psychrotolerans]TDE18454.1 DUF4920 domain-containing protein [Dyadobacter psychrotolerans]
MKKIFTFIFSVLSVYAVQAQTAAHFGKDINDKKAIEASALPKKMGTAEAMPAKVTGTVESVCQVKGCWMKVKMDNGETMRVMFKDYAFFVPKDIAGKTVVFEGEAQKKTVPVEHLQHYALDAGKSKEEVAKITEPKEELTFIADGVIVK